jgi:ribulose-phosphate 3-epimerase
MSRT